MGKEALFTTGIDINIENSTLLRIVVAAIIIIGAWALVKTFVK